MTIEIDEETIVTVGGTHPALIVIGNGYDKASSPSLETVREIISTTEWGLSSIYDIREGNVEIQHEYPPTEPYDAWGVVVVFGQSPAINSNKYANSNGPILEAQETLFRELDDIEIWIDGV